MPITVEGTYKDGKLILDAPPPPDVTEARVLVTFLSATETEAAPTTPGRIYFGMFKGDGRLEEADFRIAEWRGDSEQS
jgi:hypothetical protein